MGELTYTELNNILKCLRYFINLSEVLNLTFYPTPQLLEKCHKFILKFKKLLM